jgi:hypothetical protein
VTPLSEWLELMLAEIARKREERERAREEQVRRSQPAEADERGLHDGSSTPRR